MVTYTAYTLPTEVSDYPVPNPKVCRWGLSHSESGGGLEVWLKPVYLGSGKGACTIIALLLVTKAVGILPTQNVVAPANAWDTLLLWKPIPMWADRPAKS